MSSTNVADGESVRAVLMTVQEVGRALQLSVRSVWRLRSAGLLPEPVKLGGAVRWNRETIDEWIRQGCPRPTSRENEKRRT